MWTLSTFRSAFTSVLGWTFDLGPRSFNSSNRTRYLDRYCCQPTIRKKENGSSGLFSFFLGLFQPSSLSLTFSNMFNDSVGAINAQVIPLFAKIFPFLDGVLIPWKTDPTWTKIALIMMQGWLGFPYIYVLTLGILQSIPNDLYEAAYIDGANGWQKFRNITFPMILAVAAPTLISQYTFNFNNFSIIYLFNDGDLVLSEETLDLQIS